MRRIIIWLIVLFRILRVPGHKLRHQGDSQVKIPQPTKGSPAGYPSRNHVDATNHPASETNDIERSKRGGVSNALSASQRNIVRHRRLFTMLSLAFFLFAVAEIVWFQMFSSDWIEAYVFNNSTAPRVHIFTGYPIETAKDEHGRLDLPISLTLKIDSFDPSSGLMHGQVQLLLGRQWFNENLRVPKVIYVNGSSAKVIRHLRACANCSQYATSSVPYQEVAFGTSAAFPSDMYYFGGNFRLGTGEVKPIHEAMRTSLMIGPSLKGYLIQTLRTGTDTTRISVLLSRPRSEVIWYYVIALAPVMLIIVLLWQLATGIRITLEAGIGIIAILSLRQVLVPSDINGITRIDILLGLEVVMMIVLVSIGALRHHVSTESGHVRPDSD